ncbi:MAG: hypothetical protein CAPSK01_001174 [Candidatus Accumulibacter vicinus]|uniref:Uncharacterized protein n=2 Tax=Candidatus Accumulibacter vicinus TaxID=2954382 RepID=A0A084Y2P1_9PROT|nr:MAG: hypothetical protein CAPSK01_001174 [Candidatus Accumulibacter vicinus]
MRPIFPGKKRAAQSPNIAYEHSLHLDVPENKIGSSYEAVQAACREATANQCVLLESSLVAGVQRVHRSMPENC